MFVTVEVKRILYTSETLKVFVGWYEDLRISFRCRGTLIFEPQPKDKITLNGEFRPEMGDQVFFFIQGERFVPQDIKTMFADITIERQTKKTTKKEKAKMDSQTKFRIDNIGKKPDIDRYGIATKYAGSSLFVFAHYREFGLEEAVKTAQEQYQILFGELLDAKWICTYAMKRIWYDEGEQAFNTIVSRYKNRWSVFHAGEFYANTIAVSSEKACNNVRWRFQRDRGFDDGQWSATPIPLPWYTKSEQQAMTEAKND